MNDGSLPKRIRIVSHHRSIQSLNTLPSLAPTQGKQSILQWLISIWEAQPRLGESAQSVDMFYRTGERVTACQHSKGSAGRMASISYMYLVSCEQHLYCSNSNSLLYRLNLICRHKIVEISRVTCKDNNVFFFHILTNANSSCPGSLKAFDNFLSAI